MPFWKVRANAVWAHLGETVKPGAVVELPRRLANEFTHVLDECGAAGELLSDAVPSWIKALETIPAHEAVDVLRAERDAIVAQLPDAQLAAEEAGEAARVAAGKHAALSDAVAAIDAKIESEIKAAKALLDQRLAAEAAAKVTPATAESVAADAPAVNDAPAADTTRRSGRRSQAAAESAPAAE